MKIGLAIGVAATILSGCSSMPNQELSSASEIPYGGCMYEGEMYSIGATKRAGRVVNDGGSTRVVDNPNGVLMTSVSEPGVPGSIRWDTSALSSR